VETTHITRLKSNENKTIESLNIRRLNIDVPSQFLGESNLVFSMEKKTHREKQWKSLSRLDKVE